MAFISAFVAITTAVLGVAGTIIGSVLSSVLYNVLSEALQKPVDNAKLKANFEWEIAYSFPLIVMALIQLLLIFAMLSEMGFLPSTFLNVYLSLQNVADNNLYRVLEKRPVNHNLDDLELIQIRQKRMDASSKDNSYREHGYREKPIKHRVRRNQINKSSENIQFETNGFLDDYKK